MPATVPAVALEVLRVGVGTVLTAWPRPVAAAAAGRPPDPPTTAAVRVLGLRHLAQGAGTLAAPTLLTPRRGALIDGLHATTMVALAARSRRHRRAAAASAGLAAAFAVVGTVADG